MNVVTYTQELKVTYGADDCYLDVELCGVHGFAWTKEGGSFMLAMNDLMKNITSRIRALDDIPDAFLSGEGRNQRDGLRAIVRNSK